MAETRFRPRVLVAALAGSLFLSASVLNVQARPDTPFAGPAPFASQFSIQPAIISGKENTSAIVQNRGASNAAIAMDVYTEGGLLVPAAGQVKTGVPVGGSRNFAQGSNAGLSTNFRGVGVISSDQPFNALLVRDIKDSNGQKSYSIVSPNSAGSTKVALPFLMNNRYGRHTRFTLANAGSSVACVSIEYSFPPAAAKEPVVAVGPGGDGCAAGLYPVPVQGQVSFAPNTIDGAIAMPLETATELMAATITSVNDVPITASVDAYNSGGDNGRNLGSYDGFRVAVPESATDDVGLEIALPIVLKSSSGWFSQALLSNPGAADADVTITYTGNVSGTPLDPIVDQFIIPAGGMQSASVYALSEIPVGFVGSATVTSTQPLAAVLFRVKQTTAGSGDYQHPYAAASGLPLDRATTTVRLPLIFRHALRPSPVSSKYGYNSWFSVIVADGSLADVTINALNDPTSACAGSYTSTLNTTVT
ncbi:MAG TPA: hypothetical protein VIH05_04730, partial [Tepidiformaceae bacterium]